MINLNRLAKAEIKIASIVNAKTNYNLPTKEELRDFLTFIKYFYHLRTGREYRISQPVGREPHQITMCKQVPRIINHELNRILFRIAPRYGKTEFMIHLNAYCIAYFPGSNYIYASYAADLAVKQTKTIRNIIELPQFEQIFGVTLDKTSKASDDWMTNTGCRMIGMGAGGPVTGNGAGIRFSDQFGGFITLDDLHKPIEVTHEKSRQEIKDWVPNTLLTRLNNPEKTPIVGIAQALHEDDAFENLIIIGTDKHPANPLDTKKWEVICLDGLDEANNALDPGMHDVAAHIKMRDEQPYMWWAQYQHKPMPPGGSLFKEEWFQYYSENPQIITTFITVDSADTDKNWNDATVFSFWGYYHINHGGIQTDIKALHWLDCWELRVEPHELLSKFEQFYLNCCRFHVRPSVVGIEKKSSGITLLSVLNKFQGIRIVDTIDYRIDPLLKESMKRAKKADRFLACQQYVSNKLITFTTGMKHASMCIEHLLKITANDSHAFDDIADTMADAIYMSLITDFVPSLKPLIKRVEKGMDLTKPAIRW